MSSADSVEHEDLLIKACDSERFDPLAVRDSVNRFTDWSAIIAKLQ